MESGKPARMFSVADNEKEFYRDLFLLTSKPVLYMANTDEDAFMNKNPHVLELEELAKDDHAEVVRICAKLEEEISTFDDDDKREFLHEIGVDKTGPQAAGKIHTDFERGFIRAEVIAFKDLEECMTMAAAREKGLIRSEGKEYIVRDGDVILFRFNV